MTRIAKRVLAFRERKRPGSIMRPSTFADIEREAARGGARDPAAVAGAAYWKTLAARYRGNPISEEPDPNYPGEMRFVEWRRAMLGFINSHWYGRTLTDAEYREIAKIVHMPPEAGFDWSFIRDAEDAEVIKAFLYVQARHPELGPHRGFNPSELAAPEGEELIFVCPHCEEIFTPAEVEAGAFRRHMMEHRAERETNPIHIHIRPDPATGKFLASMFDERFGNLYATGYTKKQAAAALRDEWRRVLRTGSWRNPADGKPTAILERIADRYYVLKLGDREIGSDSRDRAVRYAKEQGYRVTHVDSRKHNPRDPRLRSVPEILDECDKLRKAIRGRMMNSTQRYAVYKDNVLDSVKKSLKQADRAAEKLRDKGHSAQVVGPRDFFNKKLGENPDPVGVHRGVQMFFEGISYNAPSLKLYGYSTDLALQRAIDRKLRKAGSLQDAVKRAQFGKNPAARVETYQLRAGATGRPVRKATKVVFEDGREVKFTERMPKRKAIRQAIEEIARHPESFRNPEDELDQAAGLYRTFHGREPREVIELAVTAEQAGDYTVLGDLVELTIQSPSGNRVELDFKKDGVRLASSPDGSQLYLFDGNQDLTDCLEKFEIDVSKPCLDLGDALRIVYDAAKWQTDFKPQEWEHKFGEESGISPRIFYEVNPLPTSKQQIFFAGGTYRVERPGIVD